MERAGRLPPRSSRTLTTATISCVPTASIVIPTRGRPGYLDGDAGLDRAAGRRRPVRRCWSSATVQTVRRLRSPHATACGLSRGRPAAGANAARNAGVAAAEGDLIVFVDDDVDAPPDGSRRCSPVLVRRPDRRRLRRPDPGSAGGWRTRAPAAASRRRSPRSTSGPRTVMSDSSGARTWRFAAGRSSGSEPFDEALLGRGEEEDWQRRYAAEGGRIRYLAGAGLEPPPDRRRLDPGRVSPAQAMPRGEQRAATTVARATRPSIASELRTLAGCVLAHRAAALRDRDRDGRPHRRPPARGAGRAAA